MDPAALNIALLYSSYRWSSYEAAASLGRSSAAVHFSTVEEGIARIRPLAEAFGQARLGIAVSDHGMYVGRRKERLEEVARQLRAGLPQPVNVRVSFRSDNMYGLDVERPLRAGGTTSSRTTCSAPEDAAEKICSLTAGIAIPQYFVRPEVEGIPAPHARLLREIAVSLDKLLSSSPSGNHSS